MRTTSNKSRTVAVALAAVLGVFGAHRFYVGKVGTGILMICTLGGLGIWYLVDVIVVAAGGFTDADGRRVLKWDIDDYDPSDDLEPEVLDEIANLRLEVDDLARRMDFAERVLADPDGRASRQK